MSKAQRQKRKAKSRIRNTQYAIRNTRLVFVIIAILAAIPFGLGKYMEFNTPGPYDSGGYVYSAKHILDGAVIGVEEKPSARMGTLLVNMLGVWLCGFNETGPKLIQTILQAMALVLMFIAMQKLFGTLPAAVGVIVASVYLSAPLIAKFGNVKEQYMVACMVMGVSCFVLYQLGGKWWYAVLAGALVGWAPLFKQTSISAIGAIGLFVILQPLLKHRTWKQTCIDILLLLAGAAISVGPVYLWLAINNAPFEYWPYAKLWWLLSPGEGERVGRYISKSRQMLPFFKLAPRVFRYYGLLILPIALAVSAIAARVVRIIRQSKITNRKLKIENRYDRFVLLFAVWWVLDMAFVWVSPRSYEQYYLPLNASAAMLGGYLIALYSDKFSTSPYKGRWSAAGSLGLLAMIMMSWHIFFGITTSPHSGATYRDRTGNPEKRRGYAQKLEEVSRRRKGILLYSWEQVGEYIYTHSEPTDKIYVWGWVPGIYVQAQRFSPAPKAFEGTMHTLTPEELAERIDEILSAFERQLPKFIVDSRKRHFPWDKPPLELWPQTKKGFLPADKRIIDEYDAAYSKMLHEKIGPDEALRYEVMKPFREFVMKNYKIVRPFGQHVLFEIKGIQTKK